jgi:uncharacterized repeat protein (TIGR01451 family)
MLKPSTALFALGLFAWFPNTAFSNIDNTAQVRGSYGGQQVTAEDTATVPVSPASPDLEILKAVSTPTISNGSKSDRADAGDTITYTITVTNIGNVTLTGVTPVDTGPKFNGQAGTGSFGSFVVRGTSPSANAATLAPGESAIFEATYIMSDLDVYHAADVPSGVVNKATARGNLLKGEGFTDADEAQVETSLPHKAEIALSKSALLNDLDGDNLADKDETITYTYTVTNVGNVPLSGISVTDIHEGATLAIGTDIISEKLISDGPLSTGPTASASVDDGTGDNGIWGLLQPEAIVSFTYIHTVTQAEVDGG